MIEDRDLLLAAAVTFAIVVGILGVWLVLDPVSLARNGGVFLVGVVGIAIEFVVAVVSCRRWPWLDPRTPVLIVAGAILSVSAFLPMFEVDSMVRLVVFLLGGMISIIGIAARNL